MWNIKVREVAKTIYETKEQNKRIEPKEMQFRWGGQYCTSQLARPESELWKNKQMKDHLLPSLFYIIMVNDREIIGPESEL